MTHGIATGGRGRVSPDTLLRHYVRYSCISLVVIVLLICYGTYLAYLKHLVADAEGDSVALAGSIMEMERSSIVVPCQDGREELRIAPADLHGLDHRFGLFFRRFHILKVKIYDRSARVIYSNDRSLIGRDDPQNPRLLNALAGRLYSKVEEKESLLDFNGEEKFSVDVVETYVPVHDRRGTVIGSFELYQDVTHCSRSIVRLVTISGVMLALILASVFSVSYLLLRKETRQLEEMEGMLLRQATTDFLTGVSNRRQILRRCEEEMSRLWRMRSEGESGGSIGFIMVDVDLFKRINDTWGHAAGDEILRELAMRLKDNIRLYDFIGRYGGEEFLVVLPDATAEQLSSVADRLWSSIRCAPFIFEGEEINVTISLGVAVTSGDDATYEAAVRRADDALYRSKNGGRDRITYG